MKYRIDDLPVSSSLERGREEKKRFFQQYSLRLLWKNEKENERTTSADDDETGRTPSYSARATSSITLSVQQVNQKDFVDFRESEGRVRHSAIFKAPLPSLFCG